MILFVDINDVFRAPMAARLYKQLSGKPAHSAGVYAYEGSCLGDAVRPDILNDHRSRQLSEAMLQKAEAVWCVTASIARHLKEEYSQYVYKIYTMENIEDPTGMGREAYEWCAKNICAQVEKLI